MSSFLFSKPDNAHILIVDDEPDVHAVTRLGLKGLRHEGSRLKFLSAESGAEGIEILRARPDIAVVLLDVVMESDHAGLEACRLIRQELNNHFVRILLRTGQPGMAPERKTIDEYDIDDYLPKAELTTTRLYTAVRTALKAWNQIVELECHRSLLSAVSDCAISLRSFDDLEVTLEQILASAVAVKPTSMATLQLETFDSTGNTRRFTLHHFAGDSMTARLKGDEIAAQIGRDPKWRLIEETSPFENGLLVPLVLHREMGSGWVFLDNVSPDPLTLQVLNTLAAHAANALYASVAQSMLASREGPLFDTMSI